MCELGCSESQQTQVIGGEHRATGEKCAIKIVDKRNCDAKQLKLEITILKKLTHPNIVELNDVFEVKKYIYLVMER